MKKLAIISVAIILLAIFHSKKSHSRYSYFHEASENTDTIITLNDSLSLYFASYNPAMKLWYNLYIINKKDSIKLSESNDYDGVGSEVNVSLSPNAKYVVTDNVKKGYVYESDTDSTLHENYGCMIIDLNSAKAILYLQSECDGRWNKNNEWISNGRAIFIGKRL